MKRTVAPEATLNARNVFAPLICTVSDSGPTNVMAPVSVGNGVLGAISARTSFVNRMVSGSAGARFAPALACVIASRSELAPESLEFVTRNVLARAEGEAASVQRTPRSRTVRRMGSLAGMGHRHEVATRRARRTPEGRGNDAWTWGLE